MPSTGIASASIIADASALVQIELVGGGTTTMTVSQAVTAGLLRAAGAAGTWQVNPAAAVRARATTAPAAHANTHGTMHAILGMEEGAGSGEKPKAPSEIIGNIASVCFLTRGLLTIAKGPGVPSWQSVYFAAHGINRYTNHKFLPEWLAKGPVKDVMEYAIIGDMLMGSIKQLPKANAGFMSAVRGAGAASSLPAKAAAFARGIVAKLPADAAEVAASATKAAAPAAGANVPFLAKLFPMIKPLYYIGMTASSVSSIIALPERLREQGTKGLINTTSGRDAVIGALSGASMLASMYMPASPLQLYVDFASSVLWLAQALNGHGVLDGLLGGDPKEDATKPAGDGDAATAGSKSSGAKAPAAAAADTAKAMQLMTAMPVLTIPHVASAGATAAHPRKRRHAA